MRAAITLHPDMAPVLGFEPSLTVLEAAALLSVTDIVKLQKTAYGGGCLQKLCVKNIYMRTTDSVN